MEAEPLLLELKIEVDAPLERSRTEHESSAPPMEVPKVRLSAGLSPNARPSQSAEDWRASNDAAESGLGRQLGRVVD
jgi:hypothetical protein